MAVEFSGLTGFERAGLLFYDLPSIGSNSTIYPGDSLQHDYFVQHTAGVWRLLDTPQFHDNLGVRFFAVPEPSGTTVAGADTLLLTGLIVRRGR